MPVYLLTAFIEAPSQRQAEIVANERTEYEEDLGFPYRIRDVRVQAVGPAAAGEDGGHHG